jgi:hypothetical protein
MRAHEEAPSRHIHAWPVEPQSAALRTLRALCSTAKTLSVVGEEDPVLVREMRARATEYDPALADASLDEICNAAHSRFEPWQLGTLGALPSELIYKVMEQPGALRLMTTSPWLYSMSKGVIEGHRSRCRRAAAPLPMEARCIDEKPDIDCLRACHALFEIDPRAATGAVLRGALALAGIDANTARTTNETPRLLLRPARAALESFRHLSEWALAFQYCDITKEGQMSSECAVELQLWADSVPITRATAYVHLKPLSATPWRIGVAITTKMYDAGRRHKEYASWEDVENYIWKGIRIMASTLPKETRLGVTVSFSGKAYVQYDFASGDLNDWISTVFAVFQPYPFGGMLFVQVRTSDERHGILLLDTFGSMDELKAWAAGVFAKARLQASYATPSITDDLAIKCTFQFNLPYHLQVAKILSH